VLAVQDLVVEYSSGTAVAVEVCGPQAVRRVRDIVGPRDIDVAKRVRCAKQDTLSNVHKLLCQGMREIYSLCH
jgi:nucleoside diphosphate kinase